jgi:hypothetical protein
LLLTSMLSPPSTSVAQAKAALPSNEIIDREALSQCEGQK